MEFCPEFDYLSVLKLLLKETCNKSHLDGWSLVCPLAVIMPSLPVLDKIFFVLVQQEWSGFKFFGFAFFFLHPDS